jgi:hypothetical protein
VASQQLADRLPDLAGGGDVMLGCTITQLCETMEDEPILKAPSVGELVLPVLEIGGVDEVADQFQRVNNLR